MSVGEFVVFGAQRRELPLGDLADDGPAPLSNASWGDDTSPDAASDGPGTPERPPPTGEQSAAFCDVRATLRP
ncbi:hypothetical protein BRC84_02725 [Halobacteriales archaeon QS_1_68_44]|nr:MAG: hypothetical protein BRC84_02725 [Halobacteriales archaeon QS_1_68_44]